MIRTAALSSLLLAFAATQARADSPALDACLKATADVVAPCSKVIDDPATSAADRVQALTWRAEAQGDLKQFDAAQTDLRNALGLEPRNIRALVDLGLVLGQSGAPAERQREPLDRALAIEPDHVLALVIRARLSAEAGHWESALEDLDRAHRAAPDDELVLRRRGEAYDMLRRYDEAMADYQAVLKRDPSDRLVLADIGYLRLLTDDPQGALEAADRLLKTSPDDGPGLFIRASALGRLDRGPEAMATFETLVRWKPDNLRARTALGELYLDVDKPELAEAQGDAALKLAPKDVDALLLRGQARALRGNLKDALADDEQAVSLSPTVKPIYQRGLHRSMAGDHAGALADLRKAAELEPDAAAAWLSVAEESRSLGDDATATEAVSRALKLEPDYAQAWSLRGDLYGVAGQWARAADAYERAGDPLSAGEAWDAAGDPAKALDDIDRAVKLDPRSSRAWHDRGSLLAYLGRAREALKAYDRGLALAPADAEMLVGRSGVRETLKDQAGAEADLDAAAKADPNSAFVFNARGLYDWNHGRLDAGLAEFDRAIELGPEEADIYFNRALILIEQNHQDRAIRDLNLALKLDPKDARAMALKGEAFRRLGDQTRALEVLDAAVQLDPDLAVALWRRGLVEAELGDKAAAEADRARALKLDPTLSDD